MDLLKLPIESLTFSHALYCLPVWGPSLSDVNYITTNRLKCLQHRAIHLCIGSSQVWPYISSFPDSNWLPLRSMIQYRTLCAIHQQYFQPYYTPMVPPLVFGRQHQYATWTTQLFAQPPRYTLAFSQRFFYLLSTIICVCKCFG